MCLDLQKKKEKKRISTPCISNLEQKAPLSEVDPFHSQVTQCRWFPIRPVLAQSLISAALDFLDHFPISSCDGRTKQPACRGTEPLLGHIHLTAILIADPAHHGWVGLLGLGGLLVSGCGFCAFGGLPATALGRLFVQKAVDSVHLQ